MIRAARTPGSGPACGHHSDLDGKADGCHRTLMKGLLMDAHLRLSAGTSPRDMAGIRGLHPALPTRFLRIRD